jgi:mannose-6-phosphate isomerase-like protein (cupin superfamily)
MHVIHEPTDISFDRVGVQGKVFPVDTLTDNAGFVLISTSSGHDTTIIEHDSDFIFYVLEGTGYFEINGEQEKCSAGDLVVIPAGNALSYKGKLKMLLACTPPWKAEQEDVL